VIRRAVSLATLALTAAAWGADIQVVLPPRPGPLVRNAAAIFERQARARAARLPRRVELVIRAGAGGEGFTIAGGPSGGVRVIAAGERGLLYGLGKLLRTPAWRGGSAPASPVRGIYFASHFGNFYEAAPADELRRYVEELALWGVNSVVFNFPQWQYASFDDPAARANLERIRLTMRAARRAGMRVGLLEAANQGFKTTPPELLAQPFPDDWKRRGALGVNVCPSRPAGREYLTALWRRLLDEFKDPGLDYVAWWPYDEGGCGCKDCWPWGARGYPALCRDVAALARARYPAAKFILSTWMYDSPPAGEWEGLARLLAADKTWADYIMADAHEAFPRYPLDRGVPGGLPLVNFPEISMWRMWPWGGYGANPLPAHSQELWNQVAGRLAGGFPYSEGIYEDINKAIYAQFYWDPRRQANDTVKEYIAYEYSPEVVDDVAEVIRLLEANHRRGPSSLARDLSSPSAAQAFELLKKAEGKLSTEARAAWRWRILYLRAQIDAELHNNGGRLRGPVLKQAFDELVRIYHAEHVHTNKVAPPPLE
jgi:hypothetical protein